MSNSMTKDQVEDLLDYLGVYKVNQWKGDKIQFTCPIHKEKNPSCGINLSYSPDNSFQTFNVFHCFSCNAGGTIPWLVFKSLPDNFRSVKEAENFLKSRYGVTYSYTYDPNTSQIRRYEEVRLKVVEKHPEIPMSKLAPFKSGKETYQYFYNRGFDKSDMKKFMVGRDLENETITIPAFWENNKLAGIIGRYIDPNRPKNMRFMIYSFPKGSLIYPLDKVKAVNNTLIGCESMLDVIALHKWGYTNAISIMGNSMSKQQAQQIKDRCKIFIDLFDHDTGGEEARIVAKKLLGDSVLYLTPNYYPNKGKDPLSWGFEETKKTIESAKLLSIKGGIPRL